MTSESEESGRGESMTPESEESGRGESMTSENEESDNEESMISGNGNSELEDEEEHDDNIFYDCDEPNDENDLAQRLRNALSFHTSAECYFRIVLVPDNAPENIDQEGDDDENLVIYASTFSRAPNGATEVWYKIRIENLDETKFRRIIQKAKGNVVTLLMERSEELSFRKVMKILHRSMDLSAINIGELPQVVAAATKWEAHFLVDSVMERILQKYEELKGRMAIIPYSAVMGMLVDSDITVQSEDIVYEFLMQWCAEKYPSKKSSEVWDLEFIERSDLILFRYMSFEKLEKILQDEMLFTKDFMERSVSEANLYKRTIPNLRRLLPSQQIMRQYTTVPLRIVERSQSLSIFIELSKNQVFNMLPLRSEPFHFCGGVLVLEFGRVGEMGEDYFGVLVRKMIPPSSRRICLCSASVRNGENKNWMVNLEDQSENVYQNLLSWDGLLELDEPHMHLGYLYVNMEIKALTSPWCDV